MSDVCAIVSSLAPKPGNDTEGRTMGETTQIDLASLLAGLDDDARSELASKPEVVEWAGHLDVATLPITARKWIQVPDLVAVVADMKNSTKMGTGKHAASTASIYQACTGGVVKALSDHGANFIQIQGDGAFGLFWGERRYEEALCAAITIQTFGGKLTDRLEAKWPDAPETGIKVGIANSRVLVKRVGTPRNPAEQEPVWAGNAVNFAAKAAQCADRHQLIVTGSVWDAIENNDFLTVSCGCNSDEGPGQLWVDVIIEKLPEDHPDAAGRLLGSSWCPTHGPHFCTAILDGQTVRPEVAEERKAAQQSQFKDALTATRKRQRTEWRAHRQGLK